ncbi:hypothetical protein VKT23_007390 [Stygiomarasmius scandens]|uniref:Uncharacterized protein n=1 Tax=Marasmiellus scandens TaxID=2682957 RepID=A0ABR1JPE3_9AGAR
MSSTTSSSPSPSPTNTNNDGNGVDNNSFFTPGSSPPLILAFLAIGLFSAAMVAVFGWRRVHFGRATTPFLMMDPLGRQVGGATLNGRRRPVDYGEPPKLWDLWTESPRDGIGISHSTFITTTRDREDESDLGLGVGRDAGSELRKDWRLEDKGEEVRWDNVMPLAVTSIRDPNASNNNDSMTNDTHDHNNRNISTPPSIPSPSPLHRRLVLNLQRTFRNRIFSRNRGREGDHPSASNDTRPDESQDPEKGHIHQSSSSSSSSSNTTPVQMQIAIAIMMPTPPKKGKRMSVDSTFDDEDRLEYALGFCQVPCLEEGKEGKEREMG